MWWVVSSTQQKSIYFLLFIFLDNLGEFEKTDYQTLRALPYISANESSHPNNVKRVCSSNLVYVSFWSLIKNVREHSWFNILMAIPCC